MCFFGEILEESKTAGQIVFWRLRKTTNFLESTTHYLKDEGKLL